MATLGAIITQAIKWLDGSNGHTRIPRSQKFVGGVTVVIVNLMAPQVQAGSAPADVANISYYTASSNPDALWFTDANSTKHTRLEAGTFSQLIAGPEGYCAASGFDTISVYRYNKHITTLKRANPDVVSWWGSRLLFRSGLQTYFWVAAAGRDALSPLKLSSELELLLPWSDGCVSLEQRNGQTVIKTFNKAGKTTGSWKTYGAFQTGRFAVVNHQYIVSELADDRKFNAHILWLIDTVGGGTQTLMEGSGTLGFCSDSSEHTLILAEPLHGPNTDQAASTIIETLDPNDLRRKILFQVQGQVTLIGMSHDNRFFIAMRSLGATVPGTLEAIGVTTQYETVLQKSVTLGALTTEPPTARKPSGSIHARL